MGRVNTIAAAQLGPVPRDTPRGAVVDRMIALVEHFETVDLGFPVWRGFGEIVGMLICNDRRWPEAWRVLGLQGVEFVLVGYNTPLQNPEAPEHDPLVRIHHRLAMQAGAYQNAAWAVAVATGEDEEGQAMLADTFIVAPSGEIVAHSQTPGDELVVAECDLDRTRAYMWAPA